MRLMTIAAGVAVGYVLGSRAGRQKYEQIVDTVRQLRANPTAGQARQAVKTLATDPAPRVEPAGGTDAGAATGTAKPARRRTATIVASSETPTPAP